MAAAGAVAAGLKKTDYESIPRVGVMSAVFFVASLIHVKIGPSSAHLVLPGLMGLVLGWGVFPALAAALFLQALLFGFGGVTALGANILTMGVPAVAAYHVFGRAISSTRSPGNLYAMAFAAGSLGIIVAWFVMAGVLVASGKEYTVPSLFVLAWNVPVVVIEGFVTAAAVRFLQRIKPGALAAGESALQGKGAA